MKANGAPEKIYLSNYSSGVTYNWHNERLTVNDIEYTRTDGLDLAKDPRYKENLEVKEVDLDLITGWFDHIAQIADDRMTLTNQRMTDAHALDEIKCLAKNSSEFITKHYKAQKGEEV